MVALVAVTTAVRVLALLVYRLNAYRVFPGLSISWRLFRRERLREVSGFSVFMLLLDAAYKVNYSTDVLVIGAWLGAPGGRAVGAGAASERAHAEAVQSAERRALPHRRRLRRRPARRTPAHGVRARARGCRSRRSCRSPAAWRSWRIPC